MVTIKYWSLLHKMSGIIKVANGGYKLIWAELGQGDVRGE